MAGRSFIAGHPVILFLIWLVLLTGGCAHSNYRIDQSKPVAPVAEISAADYAAELLGLAIPYTAVI